MKLCSKFGNWIGKLVELYGDLCMNKKIYCWTIITSFLLLLPACFCNHPVFTIFSGVGCSGIAAAIMAIFLEWAAIKNEKERKAKTRSIYFKELKEQLKMMLERILWFDTHIDDENFNWNNHPSSYSSLQFMLFANQQYHDEDVISFEEAEKRLIALKTKYSLEQQENMTSEYLAKVQKMFLILAVSGVSLLSEINSIKGSRVELNAEEYISLKEIEELHFNISLGISIMCKQHKNYGLAVFLFLSSYKLICKVGNYSDDIRIGLHGTISMSEL